MLTMTRHTGLPGWLYSGYNFHYHPVMQHKAPEEPSRLKSEVQADTFAGDLEKTHQTLHKILQKAQACQMEYACGKEIIFEVTDEVLLSMGFFRITCQSMKFKYKCTGPYRFSEVINQSESKVDVLYTIWKHNMFHCSLINHYTSSTSRQCKMDSKSWLHNTASLNRYTAPSGCSQMLPDSLNATRCACKCSNTTSPGLLNSPEVMELNPRISWMVYSCLYNSSKWNYYGVQISEWLWMLAASPTSAKCILVSGSLQECLTGYGV